MAIAELWPLATLAATAAQTGRNALQRHLTPLAGTLGATYARFLFGLPFAAGLLIVLRLGSGQPLPLPQGTSLLFMTAGGLTQIIATALMLRAMKQKSFVVTIAYTKTEPVLVALFSLVFLGQKLSLATAAAIGMATCGVLLMSWPKTRTEASFRPALLGVASAAFFALSALLFQQGILRLEARSPFMAAATGLALALALQSVLILLWSSLRDRASLARLAAAWRLALMAGFLGALASLFWFLGFALTSATNVRTLAMVEVIFAQIVSRRLFRQGVDQREGIGIALLMAGIGVLLHAA